MSDLRAVCGRAGFRCAATYIASGNVVFESDLTEPEVGPALAGELLRHAGRPVDVLIRTAAEMAEVLARNPFPHAPPSRTVAIFLSEAPPPAFLSGVRNRTTEALALGLREIYVAYGDAMGRSKLAIPGAEGGTARNMNTVAELARMAAAL